MSTRLEQRTFAKLASFTIVYPFFVPGTVFTNRGATGSVTATLPAANQALMGCWYEFQLHADQSFIVAAPTANTLVTLGDATADNVGFQVANKKIGRRIRVFCDGTSWFAFPHGAVDGFCIDGTEWAPSGSKLTTPIVDGVTYSAFNERQLIIAVEPFTGAQIHAGTGGVVAWQNPEGVDIIVQKALLDLTTQSTGACTLDIGVTATSATTTSDTLLDGIDVNAATGLFDSSDPALDSGANAHAQVVAAGKWITVDEKTGDATGLVANLIVFYIKR